MLKRIFTICLIIIIFLSVNMTSFAIDSTSSTTAMRMQPLIDKLQSLSDGDIQAGINKYSDSKKHWAKDYIGKLTQLEVIGGGGKGRFNPDGEMSVAAFIKTVTVSLGYKIVSSVKPGTNWYDNYIAQARKDKLIDAGDFKDYTKGITREQASKILYRAAMMFQPDVSDTGYMGVMRCRIKDYAKIGDRYKDFFVKSYILGYFTLGSTAVCNPQGKFTRAQACTVVMRLIDAKERTKFEVKEGEYYMGTDGKKYYPMWSMDPVNAINVVDKSLGKSSGYIVKPSSGCGGADYVGYESSDESVTDPVMGMDFTMGVYTDSSTLHSNWLCEITLYDMKSVKAKHIKVIEDLLKYFFDTRYLDARKELEKVIATNGSRMDREIKINDRYFCAHGENGTIIIEVTCKGGLTAKEFLEKYPN